jgi:uncharacterized membrane protein YgcG
MEGIGREGKRSAPRMRSNKPPLLLLVVFLEPKSPPYVSVHRRSRLRNLVLVAAEVPPPPGDRLPQRLLEVTLRCLVTAVRCGEKAEPVRKEELGRFGETGTRVHRGEGGGDRVAVGGPVEGGGGRRSGGGGGNEVGHEEDTGEVGLEDFGDGTAACRQYGGA